jgi:hypothetical protein
VRIGALRPEAADRAVDQLGIHCAERIVREPQLLDHARSEVLDEDVCVLHELLDDRLALVRAQIHRDRTLAAIHHGRHRGDAAYTDAHPASDVTEARRLYLDH